MAALDGASKRLIDVEGLSGHELRVLDIGESHSIDEAERRHHAKHGGKRPRAK